MKLVWSRFALSDRDGIFSYIEAENPRAAVLVDEQIADAARRLLDFPDSGRPGRVAGTRELVIPRTPYVAAYLVDGSYTKIREVSLSWDVPRAMLTKLRGVDNMRLNLAGRNLFIISGYNGFDPEVNNGGNVVARFVDLAPFPPSLRIRTHRRGAFPHKDTRWTRLRASRRQRHLAQTMSAG